MGRGEEATKSEVTLTNQLLRRGGGGENTDDATEQVGFQRPLVEERTTYLRFWS